MRRLGRALRYRLVHRFPLSVSLAVNRLLHTFTPHIVERQRRELIGLVSGWLAYIALLRYANCREYRG